MTITTIQNLVGVCETAHTTHDTEDIVVNGVDVEDWVDDRY